MTTKTTAVLATLAWGGLSLAACGALHDDFYVSEPTGTGGTGSATGTSSSSGGTGGAPLCAPAAMQPCYDGPPGTEGVGICKGGTKTCAADGSSWGTCMGEVLPQMGNCATGMDEACDGGATVCKGTTLWAERFGETEGQEAVVVAVDNSGNVILSGFTLGAVDFGGGMLPSAGAGEIFVAKLDPSGAYAWAKLFGDANDQDARGVAVDASGNILLTGRMSGAVDFGQGPFTCSGAGGCIYVAKLDPNGGALWGQVFDTAGSGAGQGIAVDGSGNVIVTGFLSGTAAFGQGLTCSGASGCIFVAKLDPDGGALWGQVFGTAGFGAGQGIAVDGSGNVIVTGALNGTADFGAGALTGENNMFVTKLDPSGAYTWAKLFGDGKNPAQGSGIAVDATGSIVVTGVVNGTVDFGLPTKPLTSAGGEDILVAKFQPNGVCAWAQLFGDPSDQDGTSIAVDSSSNIVVTGYFSGAVDFGSGTGSLASAGLEDIFVAKFEPDGTALWSKRFGAPLAAGQAGLGIATDSSSNVFVTGYMEGTVDFGIPPPLVSMGGEDIFVAKLSP